LWDIISFNFKQNFIQYSPKLNPYADEIVGIISVRFNVTDQIWIILFAFLRYWRENGRTQRHVVAVVVNLFGTRLAWVCSGMMRSP
jgi:hypothetical protein